MEVSQNEASPKSSIYFPWVFHGFPIQKTIHFGHPPLDGTPKNLAPAPKLAVRLQDLGLRGLQLSGPTPGPRWDVGWRIASPVTATLTI